MKLKQKHSSEETPLCSRKGQATLKTPCKFFLKGARSGMDRGTFSEGQVPGYCSTQEGQPTLRPSLASHTFPTMLKP
ncbi:hypothetical protein SK128_026928, partial [Halocaridina rubra]